MNRLPEDQISEAPKRGDIKSVTLKTVQVIRRLYVIGEHLRARRKRQCLRIDDAAALVGVSVDLLSRLENGAGGIRTDKLFAILDGLALIIAPKDYEPIWRLPKNSLIDQVHL